MVERKDVEAVIRAQGGMLERTKRHQVWRFPDGRIFVMSSTPSDWRAEMNNMRNLEKFLGIALEGRHKNPERRRKQGAVAYQAPFEPAIVVDWREKLRGLTDPLPSREKPALECFPVWIERFPRTPLWAILLHLWPIPSGRNARTGT